jgi:MoxR-like ATPase
VLLTSNAARELSDALKRRCLHLFIDFPAPDRELAIVRAKVPDAGERLARQVVDAVGRLRALDLKKLPSIAETLDWTRALVLLGADVLSPELVAATLNVVLKHEGDVARAKESIRELVRPA